jgi:protoporphyrinogen/coproporphyrinogen III oxidase
VTDHIAHAVIGGGISGLGAAHFAARLGVETLIIERSGRVGGTLNSHRFDACGGYWTEAGGHTCYNSYGHLLGILDDLGLTARVTPKERAPFRLWRGGKRRPLVSAVHPLELAASLPRLLRSSREGKGLADYYGAGLGRTNYRDLFRAAFQAVICQPPDDFPAELLFRKKPRRKGVPKSFTLPGGLGEIPLAIASQGALRVRLDQQVAEVRQAAGGFRIELADGSAVTCDSLTLAVGPDAAAKLLPRAGGLERAAALAGGIAMAEVETLVLAISRHVLSDRDLPPLAGLISVDDTFYSAVSRDYRPDPLWRGFAFHFPPGILDRDGQLRCACRALGIRTEQVAEAASVDNRLPALRKGHAERVRRIDQALAGTRLALTGNWFVGVSIEDCLTRSRQEIDRLFPALAARPAAA